VVVTDRELLVTSVNRAAETHWGLPSDVRGKKLDELPIGPALVAEVGPLFELVHRAQTVDVHALALGELRADVTIAPFQNERGDVLGLVLALEDVTDAIRTKEALIRSERLAAIGRMSAHVTHEIRNPLSSIGLNAEMLEGLVAKEGDEAETLCRAIVREVDRLTAITDEYLRFARLPRPVLEEHEVAPLLAAIASFLRRDLEAAKVALELDLDPALPPLHLDADQMRQALLNLVRNAKESMPQGGKIILSARRDGQNAVLAVRDTGFGIPKDSLERIFDPFFSTKLTGTGLGLALTQQIVAEHGAQLSVDSTVGVGSEFRIVMPLHSDTPNGTIFGGPEGLITAGSEAAETTGSGSRAAG
jgi:signal transduction histidine kinase